MFYFNTFQFLVLWLLQVYPLNATQAINQNSIPFYSTRLDSPAAEHTAFIDADGGDMCLCGRVGGEGAQHSAQWIYAFRQVAVCRQETPINRFYWCCLETDSRLHICSEQHSFSKGNMEATPWHNPLARYPTWWYPSSHMPAAIGTVLASPRHLHKLLCFCEHICVGTKCSYLPLVYRGHCVTEDKHWLCDTLCFVHTSENTICGFSEEWGDYEA